MESVITSLGQTRVQAVERKQANSVPVAMATELEAL